MSETLTNDYGSCSACSSKREHETVCARITTLEAELQQAKDERDFYYAELSKCAEGDDHAAAAALARISALTDALRKLQWCAGLTGKNRGVARRDRSRS